MRHDVLAKQLQHRAKGNQEMQQCNEEERTHTHSCAKGQGVHVSFGTALFNTRTCSSLNAAAFPCAWS
eukprot:1159965-Pelagomonas_calceolata.AAC.6